MSLSLSSNLSTTNLPILQKVAEGYKLWSNALPHVAKTVRHSTGEKINQLFLELIELIFLASFSSKDQKLPVIQKASVKLDTLKFFLQLIWESKALENKHFSMISPPLIEVGKMLGGWLKQLQQKTPSN